jgi:transcriptional regulator with XRE-family HTH domain
MVHKSQLYAKIGESIREHRKDAKLKQENLAKMIGLNRSSIAQIESGKQAITIFTLYQLCEALNTRVADILPQELNFDRYSVERIENPDSLLELMNKKQDEEVQNV